MKENEKLIQHIYDSLLKEELSGTSSAKELLIAAYVALCKKIGLTIEESIDSFRDVTDISGTSSAFAGSGKNGAMTNLGVRLVGKYTNKKRAPTAPLMLKIIASSNSFVKMDTSGIGILFQRKVEV